MAAGPADSRARARRVLVADAGIDVGARLLALLSDIPGLSVFGCSQEPTRVLELVQAVQPDIVVVDLCSAGRQAVEAVAGLKRVDTPPITIVLSDYEEPELRTAMFAAGADFLLAKAAGFDELRRILTGLLTEARHAS